MAASRLLSAIAQALGPSSSAVALLDRMESLLQRRSDAKAAGGRSHLLAPGVKAAERDGPEDSHVPPTAVSDGRDRPKDAPPQVALTEHSVEVVPGASGDMRVRRVGAVARPALSARLGFAAMQPSMAQSFQHWRRWLGMQATCRKLSCGISASSEARRFVGRWAPMTLGRCLRTKWRYLAQLPSCNRARTSSSIPHAVD